MADPSTYRPAPGSVPDEPGRLPLPRRARPGHLRRQGEEPAPAAQLLLPGPGRRCTRARRRWSPPPRRSTGPSSPPRSRRSSSSTPGSRSSTRGSTCKYRDDKSYPYLAVTLDEEFPRVAGDARRQAQGRALLRAVLARLGDPRDRRPAAAGLPGAHLQQRACSGGPARSVGPACSATSASARRRASAGSRRDEHRRIVEDFCDFMAGQTERVHPPARARRCRQPPTSRTTSGPPGCATTSARCAGRWRSNAVVLGDGTDADVVALAEDDARGGRPGLPRARRPDPRPARLRRREGRGRSAPATWSSSSCCSSTAASRATRCRGRCWSPSCRPTTEALTEWLAARRGGAGRAAGAAARRQAGADGDRGAQRRAGAGAAQDQAGRRPHRPQPGAGGDAGRRSSSTEAPLRIECFDVSNLQGTDVVASMVVFEDGLARKSEYRRFAVRGGGGDRTTSRSIARGGHAGGSAATSTSGRRPADLEIGRRRRAGPAAGRSTRTPAGRASSPTRRTWSSSTAARRRSRAAQARARRARASTTSRSCGLAKRLEEVWLPGRARPGHPAAHQRGALPAAAGARRGAPLRDHLPPAARGPGAMTESPLDGVPGLGETRAQGAAASTSARSSGCARRPSTSSPRCPASGRRTAEAIVAALADAPTPEPAVNVGDR